MGIDLLSLAVASAVVGGGTQAVGHVMQGRERAGAQAFEAEERRRQEESFRIAGAQAETLRREHLTSSLETIMAIRAGRGVGQGSPTAMAAYNEIIVVKSLMGIRSFAVTPRQLHRKLLALGAEVAEVPIAVEIQEELERARAAKATASPEAATVH